MTLSKAIAYRISQLLAENELTYYRLSCKSAVPTSTLSNIMACSCKSCNLSTINDICKGFNIKLVTLFDCDLFEPENIDDND